MVKGRSWRLTETDKEWIYRSILTGRSTQARMAQIYGVTPSAICQIIRRKQERMEKSSRNRDVHDVVQRWIDREPQDTPAPNALPWATKERLMAGR